VYDLSKSRLALHNYVRDILLPAKSRQPQDELKRSTGWRISFLPREGRRRGRLQ
jgi:hypothetical protein